MYAQSDKDVILAPKNFFILSSQKYYTKCWLGEKRWCSGESKKIKSF